MTPDYLIDNCTDVLMAYRDIGYSDLEAMGMAFKYLAAKLEPIHNNAIDDYWIGYLDAYQDIKKQLITEAGSVESEMEN